MPQITAMVATFNVIDTVLSALDAAPSVAVVEGDGPSGEGVVVEVEVAMATIPSLLSELQRAGSVQVQLSSEISHDSEYEEEQYTVPPWSASKDPLYPMAMSSHPLTA